MKGKDQKQGTEMTEEIIPKTMETYHYYGDAPSGYEIGGREIMLHPGQEVSLPAADSMVKSLEAQGLLVRYELKNKKI